MVETYIDRRAFLKLISKPFDRLTAIVGRKTGGTVVLLCSCRGKTGIDMKALASFAEKLWVKDVILHDELCGIAGRSHFKMILSGFPESILVAACSLKDLVFAEIATHLNYPVGSLHVLELQELCGWVHDDPEKATEKARRMLASALMKIHTYGSDRPRIGMERLAVSRAVSPGDMKTLYGRLEACLAREGICLTCRDFCPQSAILYSGQGIRIDRRSCNGCGICEYVCPLELLEIIPREDPSLVLSQMLTESQRILGLEERKRSLEIEIIAFVCNNLARTSIIGLGLKKKTYPAEILLVFLRCLSDLSPNLILHAFSRGAQGIIIIGCDDCLNNSERYLNNLEDMLKRLFEGSVLEGRIETVRSNGRDSERILELFKSFYDKIMHRERLKIQPFHKSYTGRREEFIDLLSNLKRYVDLKEKIESHKMSPFGFLDINTEDCDLCFKCVEVCQTGALRVEEGFLSFDHGKCIGCGLCVSRCKRGLMRLSHEIRLELLKKGSGPLQLSVSRGGG